MTEIAADIMKAARKAFPRGFEGEWNMHTPGAQMRLGVLILNATQDAILAERERCAAIADAMRVKHGSPVAGPYENGVWDQGARIANLIRNGLQSVSVSKPNHCSLATRGSDKSVVSNSKTAAATDSPEAWTPLGNIKAVTAQSGAGAVESVCPALIHDVGGE